MKKFFKSVVLFLLICALFSSLLAGCGSSNTAGTSGSTAKQESTAAVTTETDDKSTVLTVMANQTKMSTFDTAGLTEFGKANNINVEYLVIPDNQEVIAVQTKLASGEVPDLLAYNMVAGQNDLNVEKTMETLDNEPWVSRLISKDTLTYKGHIYYADFNLPSNGTGILYNETMFEKLGISIPETYDAFLAACETLKANGITPLFGPFKDAWTPQIWPAAAFGSYVKNADPNIWDDINTGKKKFADVPGFEEALVKLLDIYKKGYFQPTALSDSYDLLTNAMASEKYGMAILGDWLINDIEKANPNIKMGLFAMPVYDKNYLAAGTLGTGYYVPKDGKNIQHAKLALDFLSQPQQYDKTNSKMGLLPNLKDAAKPELKHYQTEMNEKYISQNIVCSDMNSNMKVDVSELFKYYQEMLAGGMTPKEVLVAWDKKFADLMKQKGMPGF